MEVLDSLNKYGSVLLIETSSSLDCFYSSKTIEKEEICICFLSSNSKDFFKLSYTDDLINTIENLDHIDNLKNHDKNLNTKNVSESKVICGNCNEEIILSEKVVSFGENFVVHDSCLDSIVKILKSIDEEWKAKSTISKL